MKTIFTKAVWALALVVVVMTADAQTQKANLKNVLTADSLASGHWKDVLTSFFQLSFDKLTGPKKELNFQSNPFALLLKSRPEVAIDTNYNKYRLLRKFNIGFGLNLDSSYRFNGFSSGVRFAIINKRDTTTSKALFRDLGSDSFDIQLDLLNRMLVNHIDAVYREDKPKRNELRKMTLDLFLNKGIAFNKLKDTTFKNIVLKVAKDSSLNLIHNLLVKKPETNLLVESQTHFNDLKKELQNALLWTASLSDTTYKDQFFFSNILLKTELLKGIGKYKPGGNWELNLQAGVNFLDDSTRKGRDLNRSLFRFEPGINLVFRNQANDQSFFEAKFSGSYIHNFGTLYANERRDSTTFNATLRVRIINDIWIPLEIKYDPRKGNVFGFLNVRFSFNGQAKKPTPQT